MFQKFFSKKNTHKESTVSHEQVIDLIKGIVDIDPTIKINPNTRLEELGFDSIKYITLILGLENIIKKDIEEIMTHVDLKKIQTLRDLEIFINSCKES